MKESRNPFATVLMIFALIGLLGGGVLILVSTMSSPNLSVSSGVLAGAGISAVITGASFLTIWLATSSITWAISQAARR